MATSSEYFFGAMQGKLHKSEVKRRNDRALQIGGRGCGFYQEREAGTGKYRAMFVIPNRGEVENRNLARRILAGCMLFPELEIAAYELTITSGHRLFVRVERQHGDATGYVVKIDAEPELSDRQALEVARVVAQGFGLPVS